MVTTMEPPAETSGTSEVAMVGEVMPRLIAGVPTQFAGLPADRREDLAKAYRAGVLRRRRMFARRHRDADADAESVAELAALDEPDDGSVDGSVDEPDDDPVDDEPDDDEPDPREVISAHRTQIRVAALRAAVPDDRAQVALQGLSCLDPRDQNPQVLRRWLDDPDQLTAVLAGPTGNGKTMAAYAVAAEAVHHGAMMRTRAGRAERRGLVVRAWTVNGYLAELRPDGSPDPPWLIRNRARWAELLILDDLGAEVDDEAREFVRKEMTELLEYRIEARRRTVFTTNLRAADLERVFKPRFWSRLNDRSTAVLFTGPDRRTLNALDW